MKNKKPLFKIENRASKNLFFANKQIIKGKESTPMKIREEIHKEESSPKIEMAAKKHEKIKDETLEKEFLNDKEFYELKYIGLPASALKAILQDVEKKIDLFEKNKGKTPSLEKANLKIEKTFLQERIRDLNAQLQ